MKIGEHCIIGEHVTFGDNVTIGHNCIIEDGVCLGDNVYIESNSVIRSGSTIGKGTVVGVNCVIGEHLTDFYQSRQSQGHPVSIGEDSIIRSGTIIYGNCQIADHFQTGHHTTIRENTIIGSHVSVGTLTDIQCECEIGDYVRLHSNVFVAPLTRIDSFVWIFPHVVLTDDPTPPSEQLIGIHIHSFAVVAAGAVILPGVELGCDSLVGAASVVTRNVGAYDVVVGNPAKRRGDVRDVTSKVTGERIYPWREHFKRAMPWSESDYVTWYRNLSFEEREQYQLPD